MPSSGLIQTYSAHGYEVLDLAVTADNARFSSVGGDKQVFLWDVSTARTLRRWAGHFGRVNCVDFGGEDGSVVISGSFDATVRIWDAKSQSTKPIQVLEEAKDSVSSLQVVGREILTGCVDGRLRMYDVRMGLVSSDLVGRTREFCCLLRSIAYLEIQIQSLPFNKRKMAMRSWFRRSTQISDYSIKVMDRFFKHTTAMSIRSTESDPV